MTVPQRDVYGYRFSADTQLDDMYETLSAAGPWRWLRRYSDHWGDYISARVLPRPQHGMVKLHVEADHFVIRVVLRSDQSDAQAAFDAVRTTLLDNLLPAIGAHDVTATDVSE